jgi:hypothetical protein
MPNEQSSGLWLTKLSMVNHSVRGRSPAPPKLVLHLVMKCKIETATVGGAAGCSEFACDCNEPFKKTNFGLQNFFIISKTRPSTLEGTPRLK